MITRDSVEWGYRLILGREPESEDVIAEKMKCKNLSDFSGQLIYSDEFISTQPSFMPPLNKWVLADQENGFRIWVNLADTAISWPILRNQFEPGELSFLRRHVKAGDTVIDIGANIGFYSLMFSKIVGSAGKVIGFEPMPFLFERAEMSVRENKFDHCTIHNIALASEAGTAQLIYAPGSPNWGGAFLSFDGSVLPDHASISVPIRPLSDFVDKLSISLIKIDVEGGEFLVLSTILDVLETAKPIIVSEIHSDQLRRVSGCSTSEYIHLFKKLGYRCFEISKNGNLDTEIFGDEKFTVTNVAFMPPD